MRKSSVLMLLAISLLLITASQMSGCSHEDSAFVTIHLEQVNSSARSLENRCLLSKLWSFFISDAYAYSPGPSVAWAAGRDTVAIVVTGDDIRTINVTIPPTQTAFRLEIPAGSQRKISVITSNSTDVNYNGVNWGGHKTIDLIPGEESNIVITMIPMTKITAVDSPYPATLAPNWNLVSGISVVKGYKLYRSTYAEGPYSLIATISSPDVYYYENTSLTSGVMYYYKVSIYTETAEGELSDYKSAKAL